MVGVEVKLVERVGFEPPNDVSLLPGMTASVTIDMSVEVTGSESIWLPATTVLSDDAGNATVWKVDSATMQVRRATVELGPLSGEDVEILSGVEVGDRIAASGVHNLREGMEVRALAD